MFVNIEDHNSALYEHLKSTQIMKMGLKCLLHRFLITGMSILYYVLYLVDNHYEETFYKQKWKYFVRTLPRLSGNIFFSCWYIFLGSILNKIISDTRTVIFLNKL